MTIAKKKASKSAGNPAQALAPEVPYEPTPVEQQALAAYTERRNARKPAPGIRLKKEKGGAWNMKVDHTDLATGQKLLMDSLGTAEPWFYDAILDQLTHVATKGQEPNELAINRMLATVKGIAPRDHVEAMLAAQMAAVHAATMTFARRLNHVDNIPQQDSASNAFNKCARTFAAQADALKRYRSSGEQKMTVEHVTVQAGGQAIVGTVNRGEGGNGKN